MKHDSSERDRAWLRGIRNLYEASRTPDTEAPLRIREKVNDDSELGFESWLLSLGSGCITQVTEERLRREFDCAEDALSAQGSRTQNRSLSPR